MYDLSDSRQRYQTTRMSRPSCALTSLKGSPILMPPTDFTVSNNNSSVSLVDGSVQVLVSLLHLHGGVNLPSIYPHTPSLSRGPRFTISKRVDE